VLDIITEKIKKLIPKTLNFKAGGMYLVSISLLLVLMCSVIIAITSRNLYESETTDMFAKANIISRIVSDSEEDYTIITNSLAGTEIRGLLLDGAGTVVFDTNHSDGIVGTVFTNNLLSGAFSGNQEYEIISQKKGARVLSVAVPVSEDGSINGVLFLEKELSNTARLISSIKWGMISFCLVIIIVIAVLSMCMGGMVTSPINEFVAVADEISKGNFNKRISAQKSTEMNRLADAMNYMTAELEHLEAKRRKFVSDASHELKTPMATIKLICDSITATDTPDMGMTMEFLSDLSDEVDRLTRIIENLLLLTKLDSEEMQISPELVDFGMMLQRIKNKLAPIALSKNITLSLDVMEDMPPVMLDYDRIWESVYNIVDNAVKYSKIGSVVRIQAQTDDENLSIRVTDSGKGIPDEFKDKIFDRFYRLDDSRARETGGTGLGLSIAKEAVLLHNGEIFVEDNPDGGSVFVIKIPSGSEQTKKQGGAAHE